jgi:hypothetical protein
MTMEIIVFWGVTPCRLVNSSRRFVGICCLPLQWEETEVTGCRSSPAQWFLVPSPTVVCYRNLQSTLSKKASLGNFALSEKEMDYRGIDKINGSKGPLRAGFQPQWMAEIITPRESIGGRDESEKLELYSEFWIRWNAYEFRIISQAVWIRMRKELTNIWIFGCTL